MRLQNKRKKNADTPLTCPKQGRSAPKENTPFRYTVVFRIKAGFQPKSNKDCYLYLRPFFVRPSYKEHTVEIVCFLEKYCIQFLKPQFCEQITTEVTHTCQTLNCVLQSTLAETAEDITTKCKQYIILARSVMQPERLISGEFATPPPKAV